MLAKGKEKSRVILFCGLSNAGKTTIQNIFTKGDVFKTAPTLGVSLNTLSFKDMNFRIFDLGGQEHTRVLQGNSRRHCAVYGSVL